LLGSVPGIYQTLSESGRPFRGRPFCFSDALISTARASGLNRVVIFRHRPKNPVSSQLGSGEFCPPLNSSGLRIFLGPASDKGFLLPLSTAGIFGVLDGSRRAATPPRPRPTPAYGAGHIGITPCCAATTVTAKQHSLAIQSFPQASALLCGFDQPVIALQKGGGI
jgi:hypothetical protein